MLSKTKLTMSAEYRGTLSLAHQNFPLLFAHNECCFCKGKPESSMLVAVLNTFISNVFCTVRYRSCHVETCNKTLQIAFHLLLIYPLDSDKYCAERFLCRTDHSSILLPSPHYLSTGSDSFSLFPFSQSLDIIYTK